LPIKKAEKKYREGYDEKSLENIILDNLAKFDDTAFSLEDIIKNSFQVGLDDALSQYFLVHQHEIEVQRILWHLLDIGKIEARIVAEDYGLVTYYSIKKP
jgi:hypothetical protein